MPKILPLELLDVLLGACPNMLGAGADEVDPAVVVAGWPKVEVEVDGFAPKGLELAPKLKDGVDMLSASQYAGSSGRQAQGEEHVHMPGIGVPLSDSR